MRAKKIIAEISKSVTTTTVNQGVVTFFASFHKVMHKTGALL